MIKDKFPQNIRGIIESSKTEKSAERRLWNISARFLEGRQWINDNRRITQLDRGRMANSEGQTKVTVNLLINMYRNVLSRLALSYPSMAVLPASPSNEDIVKAKSCEIALRYYWHEDGMKWKLEKLIQILLQFGTAALHSFYDPGTGKVKTDVYRPHQSALSTRGTSSSRTPWSQSGAGQSTDCRQDQ